MNSSAVKTFHETNQAGNYMDLCDEKVYHQRYLYKNTEWFEYSSTINISLHFNSMKAK